MMVGISEVDGQHYQVPEGPNCARCIQDVAAQAEPTEAGGEAAEAETQHQHQVHDQDLSFVQHAATFESGSFESFVDITLPGYTEKQFEDAHRGKGPAYFGIQPVMEVDKLNGGPKIPIYYTVGSPMYTRTLRL